MKVGIVGAGKMGSMLIWDSLRAGYDVLVHDPSPRLEILEKVKLVSLEELAGSADVIIVSTPLHIVKKVLFEIRTLVKGGTLVLDIASIKSELQEVYRNYPNNVFVASTHPMFGSGAGTFKDYKVLVLPIKGREDGAVKAKTFFESLGSKVYIVDWNEHENLVKYTIGLPYFISIVFLLTAPPWRKTTILHAGTSYAFLSTYARAMLIDDSSFIREIIQYSSNAISEFLEKARTFLDMENKEELLEKIKRFVDSENAYKKFYKGLRNIIDSSHVYFPEENE